jgi:hypothetical protein
MLILRLSRSKRQPTYDQRYLHFQPSERLVASHLWPAKDELVSGGKQHTAEADIMATVWSARQRFHSSVSLSLPLLCPGSMRLTCSPVYSKLAALETFVRTGSSRWVVAQRRSAPTTATSSSHATESYLVLPKTVGKEGSLIDADNELRKFNDRSANASAPT